MWTGSSIQTITKLNVHSIYCNTWDLVVNPSKTKITIFCNRKFQHNYVFTYNGQALEIDENFVYLGTLFFYNGRFLKNNQRMVEQACKANVFCLKEIWKIVTSYSSATATF